MTGSPVRRGTCKACGRPIVECDTPDEGRIKLDAHESVLGPNRFVINDDVYAVPIHARRQELAYTLHNCDPFKIDRKRR